MKTLDEHNKIRGDIFDYPINPNESILNGIACPKCGKELFDSTPHIMFSSYPPQYAVHCSCGYFGYRY